MLPKWSDENANQTPCDKGTREQFSARFPQAAKIVFPTGRKAFKWKFIPSPLTTANVSQSIQSQSDRNCARVDILSPVINCEGEKNERTNWYHATIQKGGKFQFVTVWPFWLLGSSFWIEKEKKNAKNSSLLQMDWIRTKITSGGRLDWVANSMKVNEEREKEKGRYNRRN